MDELSQRLKDLDASEREKVLQLLEHLRAGRSDVLAAAPSPPPAPAPVPAPAAAEESPAVNSALPETTAETPAPLRPDPEDLAGLPPEEVPFAFGEFGVRTLPQANDQRQKGRGAHRHRRKEGGESSSGNNNDHAPGDGPRPAAKAPMAPAKAERPPQPPSQSLASFGFFATASKAVGGAKTSNRLFSSFVPDRRIVPRALCLWRTEDGTAEAEAEADADVSYEATPVDRAQRAMTFEEWVDAHHGGARQSQGAGDAPTEVSRTAQGRYSTVPKPYKGFDSEVVFAGFYAIGYEPSQARPAYFGTYNNLQEGGINGVELRQIGRFPLGSQMPRLSVLDYDYDSGDDWDAVDGGEDVCVSSSSDTADDDASLASSDLDFVASDDGDDDDGGDGGDSETELQHRIMEARQRRLRRLRGKEKLIASHSGPFVGIPPGEHPLRMWDRLERLRSFAEDTLTAVLTQEMEAKRSGTTSAEETAVGTLSPQHGGAVEVTLKSRRSMSEEEITAMHALIAQNRLISTRAIVEGFQERRLCVGVPRIEIERTVKRFYERKHGSLTLREEPWSVSDARLFVRVARKTPASTAACSAPRGSAGSLVQTTLGTVVPKPENDGESDQEEETNEDVDGADGATPLPTTKRSPEGTSAAAAEGSGEIGSAFLTAAEGHSAPDIGVERCVVEGPPPPPERQRSPHVKRPREDEEGGYAVAVTGSAVP